jgi:hypothetical protein
LAKDAGGGHPALAQEPNIFFGSQLKGYNRGPEYTASCWTRTGTPPTQQAPRNTVVPFKATEDYIHRLPAMHTGLFRP